MVVGAPSPPGQGGTPDGLVPRVLGVGIRVLAYPAYKHTTLSDQGGLTYYCMTVTPSTTAVAGSLCLPYLVEESCCDPARACAGITVATATATGTATAVATATATGTASAVGCVGVGMTVATATATGTAIAVG